MIDLLWMWFIRGLCAVCLVVLVALAAGCTEELVYCQFVEGEDVVFRNKYGTPLLGWIERVIKNGSKCRYIVHLYDKHYHPNIFWADEERLLKKTK